MGGLYMNIGVAMAQFSENSFQKIDSSNTFQWLENLNLSLQHLHQNTHKQPAEVFYRKRLWHGCFPVNFMKFLRTPFLQNTSGRLLLKTFKCIGKSIVIIRLITNWRKH